MSVQLKSTSAIEILNDIVQSPLQDGHYCRFPYTEKSIGHQTVKGANTQKVGSQVHKRNE